MATPPMLTTPRGFAERRDVPDPLVSLNVAVLSVVAAGLLLAGILAVYTYSTPGAEAPLVLLVAAFTVALLLLDLVVITVRRTRRQRLGQ